MSDIVKKQQSAADVISHMVTPLEVNTDARSYARLGWIIVLVGVLGFLLWASFAPLDKGVPMSGTVAKEGNRKAVQYPVAGVVEDILVKDGDHVKAGQLLVRMNDAQPKSSLETTVAQYLVARSTEARLLAEQAGKSSVAVPETLQAYKNDPRTAANIALQNELLASRQSALRSELGVADENIAGLTVQIKGLQESRDSKKAQQAFLKEQLDNTRDLAKEGYIARNRLLELERTYAQITGSLSEDLGNIGRSQRQIMELSLRKSQRSQEYQRDVRNQLAEVQKEAEALHSRIQGQQWELSNVEVKAPVDGIVVGSSVFTRGGVVAPGVHMMEIVPSDDGLVVEGQLMVNLVDKVHSGLPVELIFSAFNTNKTPHIPGVVLNVAADRTVDDKSGMPYYKVRAKVSPEGAALIAQKKLDILPGMPVEMFVKTGERTMMSYLFKPVADRAHSAMSED
ncbi:HlyD family type I secretion periplasmic adaptor subunit [Pseudoduganella violacea]|uniref:Membrane fusion protein (MFP) family protein n=1 Tax=Pseudoduganella violacea TaxID=1715466 RepID=A0A7W5B7V5_9BURK|nr:HlyD family type I secretion periplasmic adaptor subunit [Pseudoduganella violacea]MBB3118053.1 protease secretion system membrane fusion protein [Pseudoduganella violacea]